MKQSFDKLELFRKSMNALVKLNCNVSDAYDTEQAAVILQQLMGKWHKDEDYVITTISQMAQSEADARLRFLMEKTAEKLKLPITTEKFREMWGTLSKNEQMELANTAILRLRTLKSEEM